MKVAVKKLESLAYPQVQTCDPTVVSFESIPVCDRCTDGRRDSPPVAKWRSTRAIETVVYTANCLQSL